ncbi:MAG: TetR/AcrR family transcriptional regulator [Clostridia bacterium]|nr:TetR/AcrR family transcriptional regulator [Clostridia bacterium]
MNNSKHISALDKLEQVYFSLLEEKHYSKISVSELIEKAGVSRMTFYRKYEDIFDMHIKVCKHLISSLAEKLVDIFMMNGDISESTEDICKILNSQRKYIALLCGENADRKMYELALPIIMECGNSFAGELDEEQSFYLRFLALSGIATYFRSLVKKEEYPPEFIKIYKSIYELSGKAEEN